MKFLQDVRNRYRLRLTDKPDVVGTMLGVKLTDGTPVDSRSIVVAVRRKRPLSRLRSEERLPRFIKFKGLRVPVDVIELGKPVTQDFMRPLACSDQKSRATVSAIAISAAGPVGVTCAHALRGIDGDVFSPDYVGLWSSQLNDYVPVGRSSHVAYSKGLGVGSDFGFADIGMFRLEEDVAQRLHVGLVPIPIWSGATAGATVVAQSVHGVLRGQVHALQAEMFGAYCDIIVRIDGDGTFSGDSGLLWKTTNGAAVAIHALGSQSNPGGGSSYSVCMHAGRVSRILGVRLLDTP